MCWLRTCCVIIFIFICCVCVDLFWYILHYIGHPSNSAGPPQSAIQLERGQVRRKRKEKEEEKQLMPTHGELQNFHGQCGRIDILQKIGTKYSDFGNALLNDDSGTEVSIIEEDLGDPIEITRCIFWKWQEGQGRQPATWEVLIGVLRECDFELNQLANDIATVKAPHFRS